MSGSPSASFSAAETPLSRWVRRSWKRVTTSGLTMTTTPQVEGANPWPWTSEIGSTISNET